MMTADNQRAAQELESWLRSSSSVFVHSSLRFAHDEQDGLHWQATGPIGAEVTLLSIPHSHCLSYLNALVDDSYPVFKSRRQDFTVEAIGFFYLMLQYINRDVSFWRPYLYSLPSPNHPGLSTPLWFDDVADSAWLQDTDVADTMAKRRLIYEQYYESGCKLLADAGVDVSKFSWDLFRWSITMFTSRSFPSTSIAPHDSKYWAAFKTGRNGARQTVLLDMSHTASANLDFSVLFPGIDAGNHHPQSPVLWSFDPGRFSLAIPQQLDAGQQIFNNYGPKPNHELLQGYGFTIANNPSDTVLLTLKAPSQVLQVSLRSTHAGYFSSDGVWLPDKATFGLRLVEPEIDNHLSSFDRLPNALLELLVLVARDGHGLKFDVANYSQVDLRSLSWQRYLPHVARILLASVDSKYSRLSSSTPSTETTNRKQIYAKQYRDGQLRILESYVSSLSRYMVSLAWQSTSPKPSPVRLATLDHLLGALEMHAPQHHAHFLAGINANAHSSDIHVLVDAGWEEDIWVLLLCYIRLLNDSGLTIEPFSSWVASLEDEYKDTAQDSLHGAAPVEQVVSLLEIVQTAARAVPESVWTNASWTTDLITSTGARIFSNESFVLGSAEDDASSAPRVAVLWFNAGA